MKFMKFKDKLEILCESRGWDRAELARRLKVSKTTTGNYFDGTRKPFRDTLKTLTDVLGVSADYLINDELDEIPEPAITGDELRIVETIRDRGLPFVEAMDALLAKARKLEQSKPAALFGNVNYTGDDVQKDGETKRRERKS